MPSCPCADSRQSAALRRSPSASISRAAEACPASLRTTSCRRNACASFTKMSLVRAAPTSTTASSTATSPRYDATRRTPSSGYPSPRSSTGRACRAADPHILRVASSSTTVAVTTPSSRLRSQTTARWISALSVGPELQPRCPTARGIPAPRSSLTAADAAVTRALAKLTRGCNNQCRSEPGRSRSCSRCTWSASSSSPRWCAANTSDACSFEGVSSSHAPAPSTGRWHALQRPSSGPESRKRAASSGFTSASTQRQRVTGLYAPQAHAYATSTLQLHSSTLLSTRGTIALPVFCCKAPPP